MGHIYGCSREGTEGDQLYQFPTAGFVGTDETEIIIFNLSMLLIIIFSTNQGYIYTCVPDISKGSIIQTEKVNSTCGTSKSIIYT